MAFDFTNPFGLVESQPSFNLPSTGVIPTTPQEKLNPMAGAKNEKLALMLYALGGALKGDKNFVQNTLQLQQMQEGKKKEEEEKKNYQDFLKTLDPESPFYDLAKSIGYKGLPKLLLERYKAETTPPKTISTAQRVSEIAARVANDPNYKLTKQDELILQISRKADPLTRGIEDISAEALSGFTQGKGTLQTYASTQDALNAGLKSGDQFKGTDGVTYRIP